MEIACKFCGSNDIGELELKTPGVLFHTIPAIDLFLSPVIGTCLYHCHNCGRLSQFFIVGDYFMVQGPHMRELMKAEEKLNEIKELLGKEEA